MRSDSIPHSPAPRRDPFALDARAASQPSTVKSPRLFVGWFPSPSPCAIVFAAIVLFLGVMGTLIATGQLDGVPR